MAIILTILLITVVVGCEYDTNEHRLVEALKTLEDLGIIVYFPMEGFVGDWHVYYAATDVILRISNIERSFEGSEITFDLVRLYHSDRNDFVVLGPYTLPIADRQVHFEENDITSEDDWIKRHHTLTFDNHDIFWLTEFTWSFARVDGTIHVHEFEYNRQFAPVLVYPFEFEWVPAETQPLPEWLQERLDEARNSQ